MIGNNNINPNAPVIAGPRQVIPDANGDIYVAVEHSAGFPGGMKEFYTFLSHNIVYPEAARKSNVQGRVFATFVVEKDGKLSNVKIIRGIGSGCDEEAVRVLRASPKWLPGTQNGQPVRQQYTVPISFTLASK